MSNFCIAIDGPSCSGKGTISRELSKKINFNYLDTGAMYRAISFYLDNLGISPENINRKKFEELKKKISISFSQEDGIILNGKVLGNKIRTEKIGNLTSEFSKIPFIREFLVGIQKEIIRSGNYIVEGRDITSVVAPNAQIKIFLTASNEKRIERRMEQLKMSGILMTYDQVRSMLEERDLRDQSREDSPLKQTKDSFLLDNSDLTIEEQINFLENLYYKVSNRERK